MDGGVGYYHSRSYDVNAPWEYSSTCLSSNLSTPTYSISPGCALNSWEIAGNDAGNVALRNDVGFTIYDATGQPMSIVPDPFSAPFIPTSTRFVLGSQNAFHAAMRNKTSIWLAKANAAGALEWEKTISAPINLNWGQMFDFDVDADGNVLVATNSNAAIDFGNGPIPNIGPQDLILAKLDPQGNVLWTKRFGGPGFSATSVKLRRTATHDFAILVGFSGILDLGDRLLGPSPVVIKFDASGGIVWHAHTTGQVLSGQPAGAVYVGNVACGFGVTRYEP